MVGGGSGEQRWRDRGGGATLGADVGGDGVGALVEGGERDLAQETGDQNRGEGVAGADGVDDGGRGWWADVGFAGGEQDGAMGSAGEGGET